jgi:hypothetical protein
LVKVKKCLDTGCTKYILLEDGRTIETPRDKCEPKVWNDNERKVWEQIVKETNEAVKVSRPMFQKAKEGDELDI